jgi:hypothetical protein
VIVALALWAQIRMGVVVRPETVTVGEHFTAVVRVRAPQGATIRFPVGPDSAAVVDTAGPKTQTNSSGPGFVESTITYVLAAWDTGAHRLGLGDVVIDGPNGEEHASLAGTSVYVRSVLPADTAQRKPKPLRPLYEIVPFNWIPWLIALAALLLLALLYLLWGWWQRRRAAPISAEAWAEREFRRVEALQLLESAHPEQHAILMSDVVREYLHRQLYTIRRSSTTKQIAEMLRSEPRVPRDRTLTLFERADMLKFAHQTISRSDAQTMGMEARAVVGAIEENVRAAAADSAKRSEKAA